MGVIIMVFKRLFLMLFAGVIGIVSSPVALMAEDRVALAGLDDAKIVETTPLPVIKQKPKISVVPRANMRAPEAGVAQTAIPVAIQTKSYRVTVYSGEMVAHNLSYSDIYKTGKLIYGHNSANLLGNLSSLAIGEVFTVNEGGVDRAYRVAATALYAKDAEGYLDGNPALMASIMRAALGHDVALMTCAGTAYGNGDASHRLVVYADAV